MNNVILKTALKTLLALIMAAVLAFAVASLAFPAHMATLFENMRAYNFAVGYAGLACGYSGTTENLARCLDDSILAGDRVNTVNYGKELVLREGFLEYSQSRTAAERENLPAELREKYDYYNVVYGNIARAQYENGDKDGALQTATDSMANLFGFPVNNPLAALAAAASGDKSFAGQLYSAVKAITPTAEQQAYYDEVVAILT